MNGYNFSKLTIKKKLKLYVFYLLDIKILNENEYRRTAY